MSTYGVCSDVYVAPGGNFTWNNPNSQAVTVAPAAGVTWPLPQSSYSVGGNGNNGPITLPSTAQAGKSYNLSVTYQNAVGGPCGLMDTTPKLIIQNPTKKKKK